MARKQLVTVEVLSYPQGNDHSIRSETLFVIGEDRFSLHPVTHRTILAILNYYACRVKMYGPWARERSTANLQTQGDQLASLLVKAS